MSGNRARPVFAAAATLALSIAVVVVALGGSDDGGEVAEPECLRAWNDDGLARSDGVHAYDVHGYRATLIARVGRKGAPVEEPPASESGARPPAGRCAVVFAAPRVDDEPDFGVRVLDMGRWAGLALVDRVPLDRIEEMQREATATANVTLLPDGRLAD